MAEARAQTVAGIALLKGLDERSIKELDKRCRWQRFAAQEQIIDRQSESQDVYFVVEGAVRVVNYSLSGREIHFDEVSAGGHFGELAALDGQPRSATVVALKDTVVAALQPSAFVELNRSHPEIALKVMRDLAHIIRTSTDRIMDLSTLGAHNRVYAEILRLARPGTNDDLVARIKPIPVHGDIASRVSTTRETVARVFSDLSRQGILKRQQDAIVVRDIEQLERMVDEFKGI